MALSAEIGVDAEYEADHDAIDTVSAQISGSHFHDGSIVREDGCQCFRKELVSTRMPNLSTKRKLFVERHHYQREDDAYGGEEIDGCTDGIRYSSSDFR